MRANVTGLSPANQVSVVVSIVGPINVPISPNVLNVGLVLDGLPTTLSPGAIPGEFDVTLTEGFATAFKILGMPSFTPN